MAKWCIAQTRMRVSMNRINYVDRINLALLQCNAKMQSALSDHFGIMAENPDLYEATLALQQATARLLVVFDIKDIIEGKVDENEVLCIVTGTKGFGFIEQLEIIDSYSRSYWTADVDRARNIAHRLEVQ